MPFCKEGLADLAILYLPPCCSNYNAHNNAVVDATQRLLLRTRMVSFTSRSASVKMNKLLGIGQNGWSLKNGSLSVLARVAFCLSCLIFLFRTIQSTSTSADLLNESLDPRRTSISRHTILKTVGWEFLLGLIMDNSYNTLKSYDLRGGCKGNCEKSNGCHEQIVFLRQFTNGALQNIKWLWLVLIPLFHG